MPETIGRLPLAYSERNRTLHLQNVKPKFMKTRFIFLILPEVHLLDLAGADQVLSEAIDLGAGFEIEYCSCTTTLQTSAGLGLGPLRHFSDISYRAGDYIIIPGSRIKYITSDTFKRHTDVFEWLNTAYQNGAHLVSICVGAFVLAKAGLLDGKNCTTHFQLTQQLKHQYPAAQVQENVLFVSEGTLHTSAGIASGIDLMLHILEQLTDSFMAHQVARELVVYNRRAGHTEQLGPHFLYRNHIHSGIHKVQDYIVTNISKKLYLSELAELANMSERHFTRLFKKEIGITVNAYINKIRVERLKTLLLHPDLSKQHLAEQVGLKSYKHAERLLNGKG